MKERLHMKENIKGISVCANSLQEQMSLRGRYPVICYDKDGNIKWEDEAVNLITNIGGAFALDTLFEGSGYTAAWYMGLVDGASAPTFALTDTAASHAGWTEFNGYTQANRPAPAFSAASGKSITTSTEVVFNFNASGDVAGVFLINNNTINSTTGVLLSCGAFSGGTRAVANGDQINVTYSATI